MGPVLPHDEVHHEDKSSGNKRKDKPHNQNGEIGLDRSTAHIAAHGEQPANDGTANRNANFYSERLVEKTKPLSEMFDCFSTLSMMSLSRLHCRGAELASMK